MNTMLINVAFVLIMIMGVQQQVAARPNVNSRIKRVSDPYFSDVQTKAGLKNIQGFAITLPVAPGIDISRIGRKRRSESRLLEALFNQSEEDQGDPRGHERIEANNYEDLLFNYKK